MTTKLARLARLFLSILLCLGLTALYLSSFEDWSRPLSDSTLSKLVSDEYSIEDLIRDVMVNRNSTIRPHDLADVIHSHYNFGRPSKVVQEAPRPRILYSSVWLGGNLPNYALLSLWSLARGGMVDVMLLVDEQLDICTTPPDFVTASANLRIVCASLESIYVLLSDLFCTGWKCDESEWITVHRVFRDKVLQYPRTVSYWKPMMGALHRKYLTDYDKWAWFDLDTVHGDYESLFPWEDARNFDILTFSYNAVWHKLYTHGQLSIFEASDRLIFAWTRTRFGKSASAFLNMLKDDGWHKILAGFDEGNFARTVFQDNDISWMVRSGLHTSDTQLWDDLAIRMRPDSKSLLIMPTSNIRQKDENSEFSKIVERVPQLTILNSIADISTADVSTDCSEMEWLPSEERYCSLRDETEFCPSFTKLRSSSEVSRIQTPCNERRSDHSFTVSEVLFHHLHKHKGDIEKELDFFQIPENKVLCLASSTIALGDVDQQGSSCGKA